MRINKFVALALALIIGLALMVYLQSGQSVDAAVILWRARQLAESGMHAYYVILLWVAVLVAALAPIVYSGLKHSRLTAQELADALPVAARTTAKVGIVGSH